MLENTSFKVLFSFLSFPVIGCNCFQGQQTSSMSGTNDPRGQVHHVHAKNNASRAKLTIMRNEAKEIQDEKNSLNTHKRATRYCALSNLYDFQGIRSMTDVNAFCYGSTGIDDIMRVMKRFYEIHQDVFWVFCDFRYFEGKPNSIEISFERYWTQVDEGIGSNGVYSCEATEVIEFNETGLIQSIYYTLMPTTQKRSEYPRDRSQLLEEARQIVAETDFLYEKY